MRSSRNSRPALYFNCFPHLPWRRRIFAWVQSAWIPTLSWNGNPSKCYINRVHRNRQLHGVLSVTIIYLAFETISEKEKILHHENQVESPIQLVDDLIGLLDEFDDFIWSGLTHLILYVPSSASFFMFCSTLTWSIWVEWNYFRSDQTWPVKTTAVKTRKPHVWCRFRCFSRRRLQMKLSKFSEAVWGFLPGKFISSKKWGGRGRKKKSKGRQKRRLFEATFQGQVAGDARKYL